MFAKILDQYHQSLFLALIIDSIPLDLMLNLIEISIKRLRHSKKRKIKLNSLFIFPLIRVSICLINKEKDLESFLTVVNGLIVHRIHQNKLINSQKLHILLRLKYFCSNENYNFTIKALMAQVIMKFKIYLNFFFLRNVC